MGKKEEKTDADEWFKDLPLQTENPAFNAEEMIVCAKCARTNLPTRLKCFYCNAELEISEAQSGFLRPNLRKLEIWEKEIVRKRLQELGIETTILSDKNLAVETPPKRLRGIEFWDDKIIFVLFNKDEIVEISNDDLILIVSGAIFERRVEGTEKRNKKRRK